LLATRARILEIGESAAVLYHFSANIHPIAQVNHCDKPAEQVPLVIFVLEPYRFTSDQTRQVLCGDSITLLSVNTGDPNSFAV
jgi:ABC-type phosphate transport system permease subunit